MKKVLKYESIEALKQAVKSGELNETELTIRVDNDGVFFGYREQDEGTGEYPQSIELKWGGDGYGDVVDLYQLLFPKADVDMV